MAKAHIIGASGRVDATRKINSLKEAILPILMGEASPEAPWIYHEHGELSVDLPWGGRQRLHIWNPEYCPPDLDICHSHTWRYFRSEILCGALRNVLYEEVPTGTVGGLRGIPHYRQRITADYQGTVYDDPRLVTLTPISAFKHGPGSSYDCHYWEIHETMPEPGTVTVIKIEGVDVPSADLYWRPSHRPTQQRPREASTSIIRTFCGAALKQWTN